MTSFALELNRLRGRRITLWLVTRPEERTAPEELTDVEVTEVGFDFVALQQLPADEDGGDDWPVGSMFYVRLSSVIGFAAEPVS